MFSRCLLNSVNMYLVITSCGDSDTFGRTPQNFVLVVFVSCILSVCLSVCICLLCGGRIKIVKTKQGQHSFTTVFRS